MIQAKELRIGNWVTIEDREKEVTIIEPYKVGLGNYGIGRAAISASFYNYSEIQPIPLNEEWLLKTEANHENGRFHFEHFTIRKNEFTSEWEVFFSYDGNQIAIKFLHELQNLFFAFHKKELELI